MAYYNAPEIDPIETQINEQFDRVIGCLNQRRVALLTRYRDLRDLKATRGLHQVKKLQELVGMKAETERRLQLNDFHELQQRMLADIELQLAEVMAPQPETHIIFRGQSTHLENLITGLGEVLEEAVPVTPNYDYMRQVAAVGKSGYTPGELAYPQSVAIDSNTNNIFVAEGTVYPLHARISIFSEGGHYIDSFTHQDMKVPYGIAISGDNVYITDTGVHAVFCFKKKNDFSLDLVAKLGTRGSQFGEFNTPFSLSVSSIGDVYVADYGNKRIQILSSSLNYLRNLTEQHILYPRDVKLSADEVYVLCEDNPCIHVFSHAGKRLRSLVSGGVQMEFSDPQSFCLDPAGNILISDANSNVKIFSKEGNLIRTIRVHEDGKVYYSTGLALTKDCSLVVVCRDAKFQLQIFSCV